jgi:hypothetical protein
MNSCFFESAQTNESLNRDGFVVIPFLDENELQSLREFYIKHHPKLMPEQHIDGIHMTTWCQKLDYKLSIRDGIVKTVRHAVKDKFVDYRALNHVFIVKEKGDKTDFKVHQDWNVVDETKHSSVNVWFPLFDVDESSGALWILKGSHNINRPIRGSSYLFPDYSPFFKEIEKSAQSVPLKAGEAIVFYSNTIHGSPNNMGNQPRIACSFSLIPEKAPLHLYFQNEKDKPLELHEPDDDFMYHYDDLRVETLHKAPTNKAKDIFNSYNNNPVTLKELTPYLRKKGFFSFLGPKV